MNDTPKKTTEAMIAWIEAAARPHIETYDVTKEVARLKGADRLEAEEIILRKLLWLRHGCDHLALYGDDGEMQCQQCRLDFKRFSATDIERIFYEQGMKRFLVGRKMNDLEKEGKP